MLRIACCALLSTCLLACGSRIPSRTDAGEEMDAGIGEVDAGRQAGDDLPNGWQLAAELPAGAAQSTRLGVGVAATADQFNYPVIAALYEDPNGDLNYDDNRVVYTRWDGVAKAFEPLKTIEVVGGSASGEPNRQLSVARDPDTGRIGIAYIKPQSNTVRLAVSDDEGANFSLSTVSDMAPSATVSNPSLALKGADVHVAWSQGTELKYRKRVGAGTFMEVSPGSIVLGGRAVSLAVDSAGNPGVAFFVAVAGSSADLAFWRPGSPPAAVASADGLDLSPQAFTPSVSLTFTGTTPHLAYHLRKLADADATELWYLKSTDTGSTWATPVAVPRNGSALGTHSTQHYQALAVDPSGRVSIAAPWSATGVQTNCVGPKLARAPDGTSFTTCSPAGSPINRDHDWMNLWTHRAAKQTLVFFYDSRANPQIKAGIVVWREP